MKTFTQKKKAKRVQRQRRIRAKISGTAERPRLAVFASNRYTSAQLIDDVKGATLASATSAGVKKSGGTSDAARKVGEMIAKKGLAAGVSEVVFDRGGFLYAGRVKAVADGARKWGLTF